MISKQGHERARLLAVELLRVERDKDRKEFEETLSDFTNELSNIWNRIKDVLNQIINDVSEATKNIINRDNLRKTWQIPIDTRLNSQVNIPNIPIPHIHSRI